MNRRCSCGRSRRNASCRWDPIAAKNGEIVSIIGPNDTILLPDTVPGKEVHHEGEFAAVAFVPLAAQVGRGLLDLNTVSEKDLLGLPHVTPAIAKQVLERRPVLGGASVTEETFPGFKISTAAYLCSLLQERIIRELDLPRHGLEILRPRDPNPRIGMHFRTSCPVPESRILPRAEIAPVILPGDSQGQGQFPRARTKHSRMRQWTASMRQPPLRHEINAPRRLVWEAMFTPDKMRRWTVLPPGLTMSVCECDARVGGMFRLVSRSEEADPAMMLLGVFTEVVLHERAIHTEVMMLGSGQPIGSQVETHEFAEKGGITTMRITQTYPSKDARDGVIASDMDEGLEACYERLDALLETHAVRFTVIKGHSGHPENERADALANEAIEAFLEGRGVC